MPTSSPAFDAPLVIEAAPSRGLAVLTAVAYGAAGAGLSALPAAWALPGLAVLLAALVRDLARMRRGVRLRWEADGTWSVPGADAGVAWRLEASTVVSRRLVILALRDAAGARRRVVLARDAVAGRTWRRLVAGLRVRGARVAAAPAWQAPGADA